MVAIVLGSHGYYAKEALNSVQMIIGEQDNTGYFSLLESMDLSSTIEEANAVFDSLDKSQGVLFLTDIVGGTPNNVANVIMKRNSNVKVVAGFNLPLLIEIFLNRDKGLADLIVHIEEVTHDLIQIT